MNQATHTRRQRAKMKGDENKLEMFDRLRKLFPKGSTAVVVLDGDPSRSGMTRWINVYAIKRNDLVYASGAMKIAFPDNFGRVRPLGSSHCDSIRCEGCGMDMGFDLIYRLSYQLYGDGYAIKHRWA